MSSTCNQELSVRPDIPFSWSFFRHTLFNSCERAYFYHYYGAQNGWDQYADPRSQSIHKLKKMKTMSQWHEEVFIQSLRDLFIVPGGPRKPNETAKQLKKIARKHISWHLHEDSECEWETDHTKLNLFEHYYNGNSHSDMYQRSVAILHKAVENFTQRAIFEELCQVKYFQWRSFSPPIYAYIDRKQVWAAPTLIWCDKNIHNVLNIRLSEPMDGYPLSLGISAIYLAQRAGISYEKIHCRKVFVHDTIDIYSGHCSGEDLKFLIETSSTEMLDKMTDDNMAVESDFSRCDDKQLCLSCKFKEACLADS